MVTDLIFAIIVYFAVVLPLIGGALAIWFSTTDLRRV